MSRKPKAIPIYGGQIKAHWVGAMVRGDQPFEVIRPGYDAQGKRRLTWTQFVHDDIPIYEVKVNIGLREACQKFTDEFRRFGLDQNPALLARALEQTKSGRRRRFKDGVSGEAPAPTTSQDGKREGVRHRS